MALGTGTPCCSSGLFDPVAGMTSYLSDVMGAVGANTSTSHHFFGVHFGLQVTVWKED